MADGEEATIQAAVVYAEPRRARLFEARVPAGSSVRQAIRACGILEAIPELALRELEVGVFGHSCRLDDPVRDGDRIEVYRPLLIDPKEARRQRAALKLKAR
jgi:uncharacterized protein